MYQQKQVHVKRIIGRQLNLDNVCRNCVNKNTTLIEKVDSVRERFNVVEANLIEKNQKNCNQGEAERRRL